MSLKTKRRYIVIIAICVVILACFWYVWNHASAQQVKQRTQVTEQAVASLTDLQPQLSPQQKESTLDNQAATSDGTLVIPAETGVKERGLAVNQVLISTLKPGNKVMGLTAITVQKGVMSTIPWIDATFQGPITVTGTYTHHGPTDEMYDYTDFQVDPSDQNKIPEPALDGVNRQPIFEFRNQEEAVNAFGPDGSEGKATIVVDDYRMVYEPKEISDSANLVQVISITPSH